MDEQEKVAYEGIIGEVVHATQPDGRIFERYRRAPGTRLVIVTPDKKLVMTRERRQESGSIDLRLPGGKVCDSLSEYHRLLKRQDDMVQAASRAAVKEGREEVGLRLRDLRLLVRAPAGATVEWDLYYFMTDQYDTDDQGQQLEAGEEIQIVELTPSEIRQAIADGQMHEWRSVGVLLGLVLPQLEASQ